jgi:hypothetical protein
MQSIRLKYTQEVFVLKRENYSFLKRAIEYDVIFLKSERKPDDSGCFFPKDYVEVFWIDLMHLTERLMNDINSMRGVNALDESVRWIDDSLKNRTVV